MRNPQLYPFRTIDQTKSGKILPAKIDASQQIYFPFGRQSEQLSRYVREQMHGENTHKNQQILLKFRREAELRKHHRWNSLDSSSFVNDPQSRAISRFDSLQNSNRQKQNERENHRFASYEPRLHSFSPIFFTEKTKPPVYNYRNQLMYNKIQPYSQVYLKDNGSQKYRTKNEYKGQRLYYAVKNKSKDSMQTIEGKSPTKAKYLDTALSKIKQIAKKKRQKSNFDSSNPEETKVDTDTSELMDEAQLENQKKLVQCKHLAKQLKKLKRYRKRIHLMQKQRSMDHNLVQFKGPQPESFY